MADVAGALQIDINSHAPENQITRTGGCSRLILDPRWQPGSCA
jgi:tRNA-dihydrouridine synthase